MEKVIETKTCKQCQASFTITDYDLAFYDKVSPTFGGKKFPIPTPTLCPDCRQQRRMVWRNERKLYRRTCDFTKKTIISTYSPDKPYKIYDQKIWRSDKRDPSQYGQDFDFSRPFFEQFQKLMTKVPRQNMANMNTENSEYCNFIGDSRNCYLSFGVRDSENIYYCKRVDHSKYCIDCSYFAYCELCYQCLDCEHCFQSKYLKDCKSCSGCVLCTSCIECKNCIGCVNLNMAEYQILNKPSTKEAVQATLKKLASDKDFFETFQKQYETLLKSAPRKYASQVQCENCIGDYLSGCKNCEEVFQAIDCEDCKYMYQSNGIASGYDSTAQKGGERSYEIFSGWNCSDLISCATVRHGNNLYYCDNCFHSSHLFGCVGLDNKQYCIFNKQYTESAYHQLVPKIVEHMITTKEWGEFFPPQLAPFAYNETIAMEEYPSTKAEATKKGYMRMDKEIPLTKIGSSIPADQVPYDISKISDDILNQAIICEVSDKPFKLLKPELDFYRKYSIPVPHKHPDVRHLERIAQQNPRKLRDRKCMKCGVDIQTTYAPERKEIVYCESCYNKEIYG